MACVDCYHVMHPNMNIPSWTFHWMLIGVGNMPSTKRFINPSPKPPTRFGPAYG